MNGDLEIKRDEGLGRKEKCPLSQGKDRAFHILSKWQEAQRRTEKFMEKKLLQTN